MLALVAGVVLGLVVLWVPFASFVQPKPTGLWRGYHTLVVRSGSPARAALPAVVGELGSGVVSELTTTVDVYDFSRLVRFPYQQLARRLDPFDPRRDPYIDRLAEYFSFTDAQASYHCLYIPARTTSLSLYVRLWRLLGPPGRTGWRLADFDGVEKVCSMIGVIAFSGLLGLGVGRSRRGLTGLSIVMSVLWLPAVITGGPSILALSLLSLTFCLPLLRARLASFERSRGDLHVTGRLLAFSVAVCVASLGVFFFLNGLSFGLAMQSVGPWICSFALVFLAPSLARAADGLQKARVFTSVPFVRNGRDPLKGRQRALIVALFVLAISVLVPLVRGGAFPSPVRISGVREFSWDALARLQQGTRLDRLPDFSDFVAHEAFQQTIGFGASVGLPHPDERVYRQEYLVDPDSGTIHARLQTVKVFDQTWLASVKADPVPGSVESLLLAQGRPVAAEIRGPTGLLAGELAFVALAFCAFLVLLGKDLGAGHLIRGSLWRLNGEARRNHVS
ncbi:MAG TPA: hypothetical protein VL354_18720 [Spirochaetia bacterium]|nr:hypothetical protein [Spirochaetia bacterium]